MFVQEKESQKTHQELSVVKYFDKMVLHPTAQNRQDERKTASDRRKATISPLANRLIISSLAKAEKVYTFRPSPVQD